MKNQTILCITLTAILTLLASSREIVIFIFEPFGFVADENIALLQFSLIIMFHAVFIGLMLRINIVWGKNKSWRMVLPITFGLFIAMVVIGYLLTDVSPQLIKRLNLLHEHSNYNLNKHIAFAVTVRSFLLFICIYIIGRVYRLTTLRDELERRCESMKMLTLENQLNAMTNQINPHFFFNSLNSLYSLIYDNNRDKSLNYVINLSNVFRYILQNETRGLVELREELSFLDMYSYMLDIKYGERLKFIFDIPQVCYNYKIPVLSLLPIIENVVKHNEISFEHLMEITLSVRTDMCLVISNVKNRRLDKIDSYSIGISNLSSRFKLLTDKYIVVCDEPHLFSIVLPLQKI